LTPPRQPRPLGSAIREAIAPLAPATTLGAVQSAWEGAVGPAVAAEAAPVAEREGVVTVACRSSTWANELDLLAGETLEKLRDALPEEVEVTRLRFTAADDSS
jgi:predicted nucleic acid-binding Zn ribbon protein